MNRFSARPILAILAFTIAAGATAFSIYHSSAVMSPSVRSSDEGLEADEYAVYSSLIRERFLEKGVKLLVIQRQTLFYANPDYLKITPSDERIQDLKKYCPSVDEEALRDFDDKHMSSHELSANFDLPLKYVLVDKPENSTPEKERLFVDEFYRKYPETSGMIGLSKIGFNKDRSQAFLRIEFTFCPLCSFGQKVLLKKEWGKWKIADTFGGWAS